MYLAVGYLDFTFSFQDICFWLAAKHTTYDDVYLFQVARN
jgi:hypothetical protein